MNPEELQAARRRFFDLLGGDDFSNYQKIDAATRSALWSAKEIKAVVETLLTEPDQDAIDILLAVQSDKTPKGEPIAATSEIKGPSSAATHEFINSENGSANDECGRVNAEIQSAGNCLAQANAKTAGDFPNGIPVVCQPGQDAGVKSCTITLDR